MTAHLLKAARLSEEMTAIRDHMRQAMGGEYLRWVGPARFVVRGLAKQRRISLAAAALEVAQTMSEAGHDPGMVICAFCEEALLTDSACVAGKVQ